MLYITYVIKISKSYKGLIFMVFRDNQLLTCRFLSLNFIDLSHLSVYLNFKYDITITDIAWTA